MDNDFGEIGSLIRAIARLRLKELDLVVCKPDTLFTSNTKEKRRTFKFINDLGVELVFERANNDTLSEHYECILSLRSRK